MRCVLQSERLSMLIDLPHQFSIALQRPISRRLWTSETPPRRVLEDCLSGPHEMFLSGLDGGLGAA